MAQKKWEHFSHDADMGVRGYGSSLAEAFAMGALALTQVITDARLIQPLKTVKISCEAPNYELLFVDWLNAIIYHMAIHNMLFSQFEVTIKDMRLTAIIAGEKVDINRHHPAVEVKGATYTELKVVHDNANWLAQCVVDV